MATPELVVGPNALGPTSRFSRRRAPAPMDEDKGPSLLLFVRGQDDFQAVTNAYQNSQIFNHDYGQNLTVQLRGNREAAELIRDYDLVIDFARILVEHFEIPVPIRDIHDPGNIWLTTRLREIYGDGWSSRYSRRVIFERLAEWSMRWTFTRWRHLTEHKKVLEIINPTGHRDPLEAARWDDVIAWLHNVFLRHDIQSAEITRKIYNYNGDPLVPSWDVTYKSLINIVYGVSYETLKLLAVFADEGGPCNILFRWLSAYLTRIIHWRSEVMGIIRSAALPRGSNNHHYRNMVRLYRLVQDGFDVFKRELENVLQEKKNTTKTTARSHSRLEYAVRGLTALIRGSHYNNYVERLRQFVPETTPLTEFPNFTGIARNGSWRRLVYYEGITNDLPALDPSCRPPNDPDPPMPRGRDPGAHRQLGGRYGPGGRYGLFGPKGLGGPGGPALPDDWYFMGRRPDPPPSSRASSDAGDDAGDDGPPGSPPGGPPGGDGGPGGPGGAGGSGGSGGSGGFGRGSAAHRANQNTRRRRELRQRAAGINVVRTRKAVYQVKRFNPYDEEDAAFIRRALQQQEAENDDIKDMKEKMQTMDVDTLDDVDLANVLDRYDDDIHDSDGIGMKLADLSEIESPSLRKAQLDGLVAQLLYTLGEVEKAQSTLGVWDIGLFDALLEPLSTSSSKTDHARLAPEWSPNKSRDKPYIANVRMNNALGLEEDLFDFLQNNAGTVAPVA